jgi:hypothetical protein
MVAWGAMAAIALGAATLGARYWTERQTETAAARPAPAPDAGVAPAQKKKPRKPQKRSRAPGSQQTDGSGVIPGDAISRMFRDNQAVFQRCHSELDVPEAQIVGRVTTRFRVDVQGVISEAQLEDTSVKSSSVARCVVAAHNGLRLYAKPAQPTYGQSRYEIQRMPD